jgi:hypoxanthine phosphoribosyltransferase
VAALARQIDADYDGRHLTLVVVLKGAMIFAADLVRRLTIPVTIEFVTAASYGDAQRSSGKVALGADDTIDLAGRDVLIVEDIVDSGLTCCALIDSLRPRGPASLALCTLLRKQVAGAVPIDIRYTGFTIPDRFVVGYGMDYAERYRNLPDICVLKLDG